MADSLKVTTRNLAMSEIQLRKASSALTGVGAAGDLKPDQAAKLKQAADVVLELRVRREFPVLANIGAMLKGRLEQGTATEPLPREQVSSLLELTKDFSHAEFDLLENLRDAGIISPADWKEVVQPHREASNKAQKESFHQNGFRAATIGSGLLPLPAAMAVSAVMGGPVGLLGATAVSMGISLVVSPKINERIALAGAMKTNTPGMNVVNGDEVASGPLLLTRRAADGEVLIKDGKSLADRLKVEVALGNMLIEAQMASSDGPGALDGHFLESAGRYHEGLSELLREHEQIPLSEPALRKRIYDLRTEVLAPGFLEAAARTVLVNDLTVDAKSQALLFLRAVANDIAPGVYAELKQNGGRLTPETQGTVGTIALVADRLAADNKGLLGDALKDLLAQAGEGKPLTSAQVDAFQAELPKLKAELERREPKLALSEKDARNRAETIFDTLWAQVMPSFEGVDRSPELKSLKATKQSDGGYLVEGKFKERLFKSDGSFSVKMTDAGQLDPANLQADMGNKFISGIARGAMDRYLKMMDLPGKVDEVKIAVEGKPSGEPYAVSGTLEGAGKNNRFELKVTPFGVVDWGSIRANG